MQDGIIKGTGNSRFLKGAGWPNSYAEFKTMAEAGTLPIDLNGINSAGWQQLATALSKGNLLSDTTAAKLNGAETPNAAFDLLSRFHAGVGNEYMWQRSDGVYVNSTVSNAYPPTPSDGYTYTPLGQIGNKVQIATGAYTGTGTYGPGNENSIIAAFKIKLAVIGSGDGPYVLVWHTGVTVTNGGFNGSSNFSLATSISADEKTLAWYNTTSAYNQLNNSGASYPYILIGV